jgi:hypothetical protein
MGHKSGGFLLFAEAQHGKHQGVFLVNANAKGEVWQQIDS